jgi:O-antigen/teichoic acid export membrane protein
METRTDMSPAADRGPAATASPARRRERAAVRNVTVLLLMRGLIVAGGVTTAALVPRTMGPATYGRYDLITMLTFLFSMLGGLGMSQVTSRQTPQLLAEGATERLSTLFGHFLVLRALSGSAVAILYLLVTRLWLYDIDGTVLIILSLAVLLRGPGNQCYALFLGQGRIGRWALPEVVRQWGSVVFSLPCFLLGGLRGAVCGYLVSETVIFTIAVTGARRAIVRRALRLDIAKVAPLLGVGLTFWASELVFSAIDRSGAVLLRAVTGDYAQVGLFGVSHQVFMAAVLSTNQIANSFVPILTVLRARHEEVELKRWVERLVKWLAVLGGLGFLGSLMLARDVVPWVLGRAYAPAVVNLVVMAATLLFLPLVHVCSLLALTHDRPGTLFRAAVLRLLCFWGLGVPLVMLWASLGACLAVCAAVAVQAGYFVVRNRAVVGPAVRRWAVVTGAVFVVAPLGLLGSSPAIRVALFFGAAGGFLLLLRGLGVISTRELAAAYRALGAAKAEPRAAGEGEGKA